MDEHRYSGLVHQSPPPDESVYDGMMRLLRTIFEPWEQHPAMLTAFFRARSSPSGQSYYTTGWTSSFLPAWRCLRVSTNGLSPIWDPMISSLVYGLLGRFAAGEIAITELLPAIDRTVFWLTSGYESSGARHASGRRSSTV